MAVTKEHISSDAMQNYHWLGGTFPSHICVPYDSLSNLKEIGCGVVHLSLEALVEIWRREEGQPFRGWDFSYLEGRLLEGQPRWDYLARAAELMGRSSAALDMGTGGGERLLELREHWPGKVVATEDHPPNYKLAKERLEPLGVQVESVPLTGDGPLPFADEAFDLVLNRHSGLNCAEVARVLAPRGVFLTQQIHGLWAQDLLAEFGVEPQWPGSTPSYYVPRLKRAGLTVEKLEEWEGSLTFADVGAGVYYLRAVPWLVPEFSVDGHVEDLLRLQRQIEKKGKLVFEARKYLVEAQKPWP